MQEVCRLREAGVRVPCSTPRGARPVFVVSTKCLGPCTTLAGIRAESQYFEVRQPVETVAALDKIAASGIHAFWYAGDSVLRARTADIVAFLRDHKLASIGAIAGFAEDGGLADYAPDLQSAIDRTANYVGRILKGRSAIRFGG